MELGLGRGKGQGLGHGMEQGLGHGMELGLGRGMEQGLDEVLGHGMELVLGHGMELDHGEVSFRGSRSCLRILHQHGTFCIHLRSNRQFWYGNHLVQPCIVLKIRYVTLKSKCEIHHISSIYMVKIDDDFVVNITFNDLSIAFFVSGVDIRSAIRIIIVDVIAKYVWFLSDK